jgi:hypothetical protein
MTDVQMPDGTIARFPDNMSDDQITAALKAQSTPQMEGAARAPALYGSALAKGGLQGLGAIGDLQGLLQRYAVDPVADYAASLMGVKPGPPTPRPTLGSESLVAGGKALGAVDRPDLQPQTPGERYGVAAAEGVGGMLPYAGMGSGKLAADLVRGGLQGGFGGAAGEAGADLLTNNQVFGDHPILGRIAGNVIGALAGGKAFDAGNKVGGYLAGNTTPTLDAYRRLGIQPTLAGDVTGNPALQSVQTMAAKAPGGTGRIAAAGEKSVGQWGDALEDTASGLGNSRTLQQTGDALQTHAKDWLDQFKIDSRKAWNNVDMHIPGNTPIGATNYATALSDVRNQMPGAPATAGVLQPDKTQKLLDALLTDTQKGPLTWADMKGIRTRIGEDLANPQLVGDTSYTDLKRIYSALSKDLEGAAAARGTAAQQAFADATALTRDGHNFVETVLDRVIKGDKITPERAAGNMLSSANAGGTMLQDIRARMPGAADELAAFKLRDMGLANAGQQGATGARLSPGTFLTDRAKLSTESADALFGSDPQIAQRIADLSHVAGGMKSTERLLNTSNTATNLGWRDAIAKLVGAVPGAFQGHAVGGVPGAIAGGLGGAGLGFAPGYLAARATSTPWLTGLLASPAAAPASRLGPAAILPPALRGLL